MVDAQRKLQTAGTRGGYRGENLTTIPDTKCTVVCVCVWIRRKNFPAHISLPYELCQSFLRPAFYPCASSRFFSNRGREQDRSVFVLEKPRCSVDTLFASLLRQRDAGDKILTLRIKLVRNDSSNYQS